MKNFKNILSLFCAFVIVFTCFTIVPVIKSEAISYENTIILAAIDYVKKSHNATTMDGILTAVQKVAPEVTLKEEDFYIKHAVDGCYDDDTTSGYPLKIEGSDGAVSAVFYSGEKTITFTYPLSHYEELIHIEKVAVVGQSEGFKYDRRSGNVLGYSGDADKIVFPQGYKGTLAKLSDEDFPNRDKVKVIMFKNSDKTYKLVNQSLYGFAGNAETPNPESWKFKSLVALDIFGGEEFAGTSKTNIFTNKETAAYLPALKYLYLPDSLADGDYIHNWCFSYLPSLCNVNVPYCKGKIMWGSFRNTGAREFTYNLREVDFASSEKYGISNGTVNEIDCNSIPSFVQGLTYVAASINEQLLNNVSESDVLNAPAALAKGWKTMSTSGTELVSPANDYFKTFTAELEHDWEKQGNFYLKSYKLSDANNFAYLYFSKKDPDIEQEEQNIISAACDYVDENKNVCTFEGLLEAVQKVSNNVTLSKDDFYIKHSVDGCTDTDTTSGYQLNISGSDGAVAAGFKIFDEDYTFVRAFSRNDEVIEITKTAIVGLDEGFSYDDNKNVIGYSGDADKIVIPSGYEGTLEKITDSSLFPNRDDVKVIIFANGDKSVPLKADALNGLVKEDSNESFSSWAWQSLRAVEIYKDRGYFWTTESGKTAIMEARGIIRNLPNLKYLALPKILDNRDRVAAYNVYCMPSLENVNVPAKAYIEENAFYNTSLRELEFGLPGYMNELAKWGNAAHNDDGYGPIEGTRNVILDHNISPQVIKDITFIQAATYVAASVNNCIANGEDLDAIPSTALEGLVGWSNSSKTFFNSMIVKYLEYWTKSDIADFARFEISNGNSIAYMSALKTNTLLSLETDYKFTESFNPKKLNYSVKVPYSVTSLNLNYRLAKGAKIDGIIGNSDFEVGVSKDVKIKLETENGKFVTYTISVTRDKQYTIDEVAELVSNVANDYSAKNSTSQSVYDNILKNSIITTGYSLTIEDFYIYKSIMGAKDNYGIITPGYAGYIVSKVTIKNSTETKKIIIKSKVSPDLKEYTFKEDEISTNEDFMISKDGKALEYYTGSARKIIIPEGIERIEMGWFDGNVANAQVLIFPSTLKEIDGSGLCNKLRHLEVCVFGDEIRELSGGVFSDCYMLQIVRLPEALESIGASAFAYTCMLEEIYVPTAVKSIGQKAFWQSGLRSIVIPYGLETIEKEGIAYPCNGPSDSNYLMNDVKDENDIKIVKDFYNSKVIDNLKVKVLSPSISYDSSIRSNSTGMKGHVINVYAPAEYQGSFEPTRKTVYHFDMNMSFLESVAYAQVYLDNMVVSNKTTADEILNMTQNSFYSLSDFQVTWLEELKINKGRVMGSFKISNGEDELILTFDRPIYIEREVVFYTFEYDTNDMYLHNYTTEFVEKTIYAERVIKEEIKEEIKEVIEEVLENNIPDQIEETTKRRLVRKRIVYPFYMQTWFIITVSIVGCVVVLSVGVIVLLKLKKKRAKS